MSRFGLDWFQMCAFLACCHFRWVAIALHEHIAVEYWFVGRQTCKEQVYAVVVQSRSPPTIPPLFNDCGTALHCGFAPPLMPF